MIITLGQTRLFKKIKERSTSDENINILLGSLISMQGHSTDILSFIRESFPSYTDHSFKHSQRIIDVLGRLLGDNVEKLSSIEIYILISAAFFHDSGMVNPKKEDANLVRETHHVRSSEVIKEYFKSYSRGDFAEYRRLAEKIAFVAESHGMNLDEMSEHRHFEDQDIIFREDVRVRLLCIYMRLGDLLDLGEERSCEVANNLFPDFIDNDVSFQHFIRHQKIEKNYVSPNQISIRVLADNLEQWKIWKSWFEYIKQDILYANTCVFKDNLSTYRLPNPELIVEKPDDATYEVWPLRFELDEERKVLSIISQSIYTGRFDYLRELIQNAIDACLRRIYSDESINLEQASPRAWCHPTYSPEVSIRISRSGRKVLVEDNGVGMGQKELQQHLFKIAGSGSKTTERIRAFNFPSIANFGVGFVSVLSKCESVVITTSNGASGYRVILTTSSGDAFVENVTKDQGTSVSLQLRESESALAITEYIKNNYDFVSVPISFFNEDEMTRYQTLVTKLRDDIVLLRDVNLPDSENPAYNTELDIQEPPEQNYNKDYYFASLNYLEGLGSGPDGKLFDRNTEASDALSRTAVFKDKSKEFFGRNEFSEPFLMEFIQPFDSVVGATSFLISDLNEISEYNFKYRVSLGALWIPTVFVDFDFGIEWKSMTCFLVENSEVVLSVSAADYSPIEPNLGVEDDEQYLEKISKGYDGNEIALITEPDGIYEINSALRTRSYIDSILVYLGVGKNSETYTDLVATVTEFVNEILSTDRGVFQDGMKLPINISDISPFGACNGCVNLTNTARFKLNVTRANISENPIDIDLWVEEVGAKILEKVSDDIREAFNAMDIVCERDLLIRSYEKGYLHEKIKKFCVTSSLIS